MKRTILSLGLLVALATSSAWADTLVDVYVNGKKQSFSPQARVRNSTAYAPLRAACEAVGSEVKWLEAQQAAAVCKGERCVLIRKKQGIIVDGRLLIPLRLMAEALAAQVTWDGKRKAVIIVTKAPKSKGEALQPDILLRKMLAAYQGAKTYQSEGRDIVWIITPGMKMEMEMPTKIIYQAPNLLYFESGLGFQKQKRVSDGKHLYATTGIRNRVVKSPAPGDLASMGETATVSSMAAGCGGRNIEALRFSQLIAGTFPLAKVKSVQRGFDQKNEWLASLKEPPNSCALTLTMQEGPPIVLWIDRDSYLLRQIAAEMTGEQMMEETEVVFGGEGDELPERTAFMENIAGTTIRTQIIRDKSVLNGPVSKESFAYKPPEGAEIVEVESAAQILGALMGGATRGADMDTKMGAGTTLAGGEPFDFTG